MIIIYVHYFPQESTHDFECDDPGGWPREDPYGTSAHLVAPGTAFWIPSSTAVVPLGISDGFLVDLWCWLEHFYG